MTFLRFVETRQQDPQENYALGPSGTMFGHCTHPSRALVVDPESVPDAQWLASGSSVRTDCIACCEQC